MLLELPQVPLTHAVTPTPSTCIAPRTCSSKVQRRVCAARWQPRAYETEGMLLGVNSTMVSILTGQSPGHPHGSCHRVCEPDLGVGQRRRRHAWYSCRTSSAQTKALAFGKTSEEVRAEGAPAIVSARACSRQSSLTRSWPRPTAPSVLGVRGFYHFRGGAVAAGHRLLTISGALSWAGPWPSSPPPSRFDRGPGCAGSMRPRSHRRYYRANRTK